MAAMTIVCGFWSLWHIGAVILAGGVGKNGSTVAVSYYLNMCSVHNTNKSISLILMLNYKKNKTIS